MNTDTMNSMLAKVIEAKSSNGADAGQMLTAAVGAALALRAGEGAYFAPTPTAEPVAPPVELNFVERCAQLKTHVAAEMEIILAGLKAQPVLFIHGPGETPKLDKSGLLAVFDAINFLDSISMQYSQSLRGDAQRIGNLNQAFSECIALHVPISFEQVQGMTAEHLVAMKEDMAGGQ